MSRLAFEASVDEVCVHAHPSCNIGGGALQRAIVCVVNVLLDCSCGGESLLKVIVPRLVWC